MISIWWIFAKSLENAALSNEDEETKCDPSSNEKIAKALTNDNKVCPEGFKMQDDETCLNATSNIMSYTGAENYCKLQAHGTAELLNLKSYEGFEGLKKYLLTGKTFYNLIQVKWTRKK